MKALLANGFNSIHCVFCVQSVFHPTFRTSRVRGFMFSKTASNWFRKFANLNAEAQRTLRTAEDLSIMHENEISERISGAAIEVQRILGPGQNK